MNALYYCYNFLKKCVHHYILLSHIYTDTVLIKCVSCISYTFSLLYFSPIYYILPLRTVLNLNIITTITIGIMPSETNDR